jgi:integrase/recombinase XerC
MVGRVVEGQVSDLPILDPPPADWLYDFCRSLDQHDLSSKTVLAYLQDVRAMKSWFEGEYEMEFTPEQVTGVDLRNFRHAALENGCKPSTWNRRRIGLRKFCQWAVQAGYLAADPSGDLKGKESEELPPRWLEKREQQRLLRQIEKEVNTSYTEQVHWQALRDQAIIGMMLYAGLREMEVVDLDVDDITLGERSGKVVVRSGKGDKCATLPLGAEVRRMLLLWIEESRSAYARCDSSQKEIETRPYEVNRALFPNREGERLSTRSVQRLVKKIGQRAGIEVSPHDLRHTFAKRLVDGEVPVTTVQKLLRHARLETTARYVKPGWGDLEKAVERV